MRYTHHERTVQIVRSGPRRIPMPKPSGFRLLVLSPVVVLACAIFAIGCCIGLFGMALVTVSDSFLGWVHGGEHAR